MEPNAIDVLPTLVWHLDEPFADSSALPSYYVARAARERVTVALSGDGGDEVFAGYEWRYGLNLVESRVRSGLPGWFRRGVLGPASRIWPKADRLPRARGGSSFSEPEPGSEDAYFHDMSLFTPDRNARCSAKASGGRWGYTPSRHSGVTLTECAIWTT